MNTLTDKELSEFRATTNKIWVHKLTNAYSEINNKFWEHVHHTLQYPNFRIDNLGAGKWGYWNPKDRILALHEDLFKFYPWTAVIHVLKHEFAHQIVSEEFKMDDFTAHSEPWERACKMINVDSKVSVSHSYLSSSDNHTYDKMTGRIQKLIALGESSYKGESESALAKAYELMERYKIRVARKQETGKIFLTRPLGILFKKMPSYIWTLGRIISNYYNVKYIQSHCYIGDNSRRGYKYIEIFGEPHHLDIAEYVFYFLIFEAERQWLEFKQSEQYTHFHGKVQWIANFMFGFSRKLNDHKVKVNNRMASENCQSMILQYDTILDSRYRSNYPTMRTISTNTTHRKSGSGGFDAGQNTSIRTAVRGGNSNGLMLT